MDRLREMYAYDPTSGVFTFKTARARGRKKIGDPVGIVHKSGYIILWTDGYPVYAHRAAWAMHYGEWPSQVIDHIDGVPGNNCISNLRDVPEDMNRQNKRHAPTYSKSGILGAHPRRNGFVARIRHQGKSMYLGVFQTSEEAHNAYVQKKRELHAGNTL